MRHLLLASLCALSLAACQSGSSQRASLPDQPQLSVPAGAQSVTIAADPPTVRNALVSSAQQRGTVVLQDQPNMVVLERPMTSPNPALDSEFGPSDNGQRVIRIRVRFTGTPCQTLAVQDLAVINNVRTALEQSFVLPGDPNTMQSLQGLKSRAEQNSSCPAVSS
ncbi:hypothetical protein K1718_11295 [Roseibium porphyridii]|uniref:DUF3035 domain-containing protein n=1 Tax=Roseibium porphyridii TaxID=2866279 RepID=A0ABY8F8T6_9HYPH|nr:MULTISPECIES: hypothetical protein [Stappiaceae]QFT31315.1 hypothetical protein FIV00_12555 [Labrenzia sp. THAF82]WFE91915.1 hypothetical protein K1718_11295 [Roseibium sp. KMA01]